MANAQNILDSYNYASAISDVNGTCAICSLFLNAFADHDVGPTGGSSEALAQATDPQYVFFANVPVVAQMLSLDTGSSMFAAVPQGAEAAESLAIATFAFTAFDLVDPLASVTVTAYHDGSMIAEVAFNDDPRLSFLDPDTMVPITALDVQARLESSTLGNGGLDSPLSLFIYQYDLSGTMLPPDGAWFGCSATSLATASSGNH